MFNAMLRFQKKKSETEKAEVQSCSFQPSDAIRCHQFRWQAAARAAEEKANVLMRQSAEIQDEALKWSSLKSYRLYSCSNQQCQRVINRHHHPPKRKDFRVQPSLIESNPKTDLSETTVWFESG